MQQVVLRDALRQQLGDGESDAIALAEALQTRVVIMDDQEARRMARLYGLEPLGTLGILLRAKKRGLIPAVRPEIEKLKSMGFYASPELVNAILSSAGE